MLKRLQMHRENRKTLRTRLEACKSTHYEGECYSDNDKVTRKEPWTNLKCGFVPEFYIRSHVIVDFFEGLSVVFAIWWMSRGLSCLSLTRIHLRWNSCRLGNRSRHQYRWGKRHNTETDADERKRGGEVKCAMPATFQWGSEGDMKVPSCSTFHWHDR